MSFVRCPIGCGFTHDPSDPHPPHSLAWLENERKRLGAEVSALRGALTALSRMPDQPPSWIRAVAEQGLAPSRDSKAPADVNLLQAKASAWDSLRRAYWEFLPEKDEDVRPFFAILDEMIGEWEHYFRDQLHEVSGPVPAPEQQP